MRPFELAECIARDASCAQGEFNQRVLSIIPYLTGQADETERLRAELSEARAEATRLLGYNEGLAKIGAELEAENERLRAALTKIASDEKNLRGPLQAAGAARS